MKSKTQDKKRLNAVGMRICALFAVLAVVFAAFMTTVPHALASETGNPASVKGKTYKIGTDTTFAPFEYRENGKMTGIDMELIRGIAKEEGFKVEIQSLGFNAALQALSSNQVDVVIAGMSITDERKASYDFSNPYFQSGIQMAVAANNDDVTGYKDLKGRTVVAKTGSEGESYAKQHADKYGYKVTSVDQSSTMYEMVKSGNAVAVFDDYPVLAYGVSQNNGLKIVTPKVPHGEYGMAVNKGKNADLLAAIGEPQLYDDFVTALMDLKLGGIDVLLIDSVVGNYYIAQQDDPTQFTVLPEVLEPEEYGIAFRKGEQTLADAVSQQLIDMFEDGTLDTIRAKWFANDITLVAQYAN